MTDVKNPTAWIAGLKKPSWDQYFMAQVFLIAQRSNDQQTKQGAIFVDWNTKTILGAGFNGHPRGCVGLPTMREHSALRPLNCDDRKVYEPGEMVPKDVQVLQVQSQCGEWIDVPPANRHLWVQQQPDKYKFMCHCETNAILHLGGAVCDHAVLYVPMPSCDMCAGYVLNHPYVKVRRIVYYEPRAYDNQLYYTRPDVVIEQYDRTLNGEPDALLEQAAKYARLRREQGQEISKGVGLTYR